VRQTDDLIDVLPIRALSDGSERLKIGRYVEAWLTDHPGVAAEIVDDGR
jgi:hypothetical protein